MELRDYQHLAIDALRRSIASGHKRPLLVMPTGSGKTLVGSTVIRNVTDKGKQSLFLAPRRELVYQTSDKLAALEVNHGIIMAGESASLMPSVQVASVNTLHRRGFRKGQPVHSEIFGHGMKLPPADVILIDEAHANFNEMVRKILAEYPNAIVVGMTATPSRADGRGLGEFYDDMVMGPSVRWLIDNGHLVEPRYFGPTPVDLKGIRIKGGDYDEKQLGERMNQPKLIGDVVENWLRICPDRQTVVFAVNRAHAKALEQEFTRVGVAAGYLDGETPNHERKEILKALETGGLQVLCSVDVLSYGWDCPPASCAVIARPTKSLARYLQVAGRVLRPYPGKTDCIIIDHGGVVAELGFVDDEHPWSLDGKETVQKRTAKKGRKEPEPITCPECKSIIRPAPECPECGHDMHHQCAKAIEAHEAHLQEIDRKTKGAIPPLPRKRDRAIFYDELTVIAAERHRQYGWIGHTYKDRFGHWPRNLPTVEDEMPKDQATREAARKWAQHKQIRYANSRQRI